MSNNPGKKGKPAPWEKRAAAHRERALQEYRLANHTAYFEWSKRRSEVFNSFMRDAGNKSPADPGWLESTKVANKKLRAWDKANPSPMSWDDHKRLEAEFAAQYVPKDFS